MCGNKDTPETVDHPRSDANRCDDRMRTRDLVGYPVGDLHDVMVEMDMPAVAHGAELVGDDLLDGIHMELPCAGSLFGRAMRLNDFPEWHDSCGSFLPLLSEDCRVEWNCGPHQSSSNDLMNNAFRYSEEALDISR